MPALRRGHHVLAGGGDRSAGSGDRRRRVARRGPGRHRPPGGGIGGRPGHRRPAGTDGRSGRRGIGRQRAVLGPPQAARDPCPGTASGGRVRRHPLGRTDPARSHRAPRGLDPGRPHPGPVPGPARAAGPEAGVGRGQAERHLAAAGAAHGRGERRPGPQPPGAGRAGGGATGAGRSGGRGKPPVRGADALDADRRRPPSAGRRALGGGRRPVFGLRPPHHPRPAGRPAGPAPARGAGGDRTSLRGGQGLLLGGRGRARSRADARGDSLPPDGTGAQGADPPRSFGHGGGGCLPLPPHPDPGRRVRVHLQGGPGRAARAVRGVARPDGRAPALRVRGNYRVPPGAGPPVSSRGRALRRTNPGAGRSGGRPPGLCRAAGHEPGGRQRGRSPADPGHRPHAGALARAPGPAAEDRLGDGGAW